MQMFFSKVHPACHSIVIGIMAGSNSKKTDKHAADCSKATYVWYVRCKSYSYNNVAKGICLLDKKQFLFIQENVHTSKSFCEIYPLKSTIRYCKKCSCSKSLGCCTYPAYNC